MIETFVSFVIFVVNDIRLSIQGTHRKPGRPFYQGKTITVIVSSDAGGTVDMRVKALTPVFRKYIPGNPIIVTEYMPGGGGRKAANYVYRSVRPDGFLPDR